MAKTANNSRLSQDTTHKAFADHVSELRGRIAWVVLVFIITSAVAYNYRDILVHLILSPLGDQRLVYLTPAGGFSFIFQITMYAGAVVTAPLLIYHIYKFVVPALPKHARRHSLLVILSAIVLMAGGVAFGYFVAVPAALHFLTAFAGSYVDASLTADSYLNFVLAYVAGLGLLFQLPLLLVFWNWMSPLSPGKLLSSERFVVVFAFIAAAIMTPTPDIFNQSLIALPIIAIYQLGVVAVVMVNHAQKRKSRKSMKVTIPGPVAVDPEEILFSTEDFLEQPAAPGPKPKPARVVQASAAPARMRPVSTDGFLASAHRRQFPARPMPQRQIQAAGRGAVRPPTRAMSIDGILQT